MSHQPTEGSITVDSTDGADAILRVIVNAWGQDFVDASVLGLAKAIDDVIETRGQTPEEAFCTVAVHFLILLFDRASSDNTMPVEAKMVPLQ